MILRKHLTKFGLIFKLKSYIVDRSLLKLMENYLRGRQQGVALNGQTSSWVLQGSIVNLY